MKGSTIKAVFSYKGYEVQISTIIESDNIGLFEAISLLLMVVKDRTECAERLQRTIQKTNNKGEQK